MSNELTTNNGALVPVSGFAVNKYADDAAFGEIASASTFLPRIMLMQSGSDHVKEGKAQMGHHYMIEGKDKLIDLTRDTQILPLAWRPKAMDLSDKEAIVTVYNPNDPEFKRIMEKSEETNSNCMYGPEYLVWVPSCKLFATYFMSSKTSRREAPNLKALIGRAASLKSQLIKGKKYSWFGPVVTICTQAIEVPSMEAVKLEVEKFANPPEKEIEAAPATERAR